MLKALSRQIPLNDITLGIYTIYGVSALRLCGVKLSDQLYAKIKLTK